MADFEDRSGVVYCSTDWGGWYQTLADVNVEVNLQQGTAGREVKVTVTPTRIECLVRGNTIFKGVLFEKVVEDESTWTIEDQKLLRILLVKSSKEGYWRSLLKNEYQPDPFTLQEVRKKLDLERYQIENPGFDFSGANLDKKYDDLDTMDLQHLGASALPTLSLGDNKTDDEKLLESLPTPPQVLEPVITDDEKSEPDSAAAVDRSPAAAVDRSPAAAVDRPPVVVTGEPDRPAAAALVDGESARHLNSVITDDMRLPSEPIRTVEPIITDDMKTEQNESLETDEEKSGL